MFAVPSSLLELASSPVCCHFMLATTVIIAVGLRSLPELHPSQKFSKVVKIKGTTKKINGNVPIFFASDPKSLGKQKSMIGMTNQQSLSTTVPGTPSGGLVGCSVTVTTPSSAP